MTIYQIKAGTADVSVILRALDATTGAPVTFAYDNAGIDLWYRREAATKTSITEVTRATADAAHADGGVIIIGDGYFRLDLPDAACAAAAGVRGVLVGGSATDVVIVGAYVNLTGYDPTDGVRLGLTALPNAAADAAGGLPISDAGALDLDNNVANQLVAIDLDHLVKTTIGAAKPAAGTLIDKMMNKDGSQTFDPATDSMEAVVDNTATADQVATATAAQTDVAALIAAWEDGGRLDLILDTAAAGGDPSAVADAVLDAAAADHDDVGSIGEAIGLAAAGGDLGGVWDIVRENHDTPGTFGEVASVADVAAGILATPANLLATDVSGQVTVGAQANIDFGALQKASLNAATPASVVGAVGSVTGNVGGNVTGSVGSVAAGGITDASIAADAITNAKIADDAIAAENFATDAIGADAIAAGGATEIATAVQTLMLGIKKNTALAKFSFVMRSSTTHLPATGLTVTCTRSIDGAAFGAGTLANVAELANGVYLVDYGAGDLNGKVITLKATATGADDTFVTIVTAG